MALPLQSRKATIRVFRHTSFFELSRYYETKTETIARYKKIYGTKIGSGSILLNDPTDTERGNYLAKVHLSLDMALLLSRENLDTSHRRL
jgi:hypothetical protein